MSTDAELSLNLLNNLNARSRSELSSLLSSNPTFPILLDQLLLTQLRTDLTSPDHSRLRHSLFDLLTNVPTFFQNYPQLSIFAQVYQNKNASVVASTMHDIFASNAALLDQVLEMGPLRLIEALRGCSSMLRGKEKLEDVERQSERIASLASQLALARSTRIISSAMGQSTTVIESLAIYYDAALASSSPFTSLDINQRIPTDTKSSTSTGEKEWLETKLEVLETTYIMLKAAFLCPLEATSTEKVASEERSAFIAELCDVFLPLFSGSISSCSLSLPEFSLVSASASASASAYRITLVNQSLLADLEHYYSLSERILLACGPDDANGRELSRNFGSLRKADSIDGLYLLRNTSPTVEPETNQNDLTLAIIITEVQDLFPDLSATFLQQAFAHPAYASSAPGGVNKEKLIIDLLEDDLPTLGLRNARKGRVAIAIKEENLRPSKVLHSRSVFSDRLDVKNLRKGGHAAAALDAVLDSSIKASIISRAEMPDSDEDDDDYREFDEGEEGEAFLEDFDDLAVAGTRRTIFGENGDDTFDDDDEEDTLRSVATLSLSQILRPSASLPPATLSHLIASYATSAALFERTNLVRRSKERTKLREFTGLSDEGIEEWGMRWKREPNKDKVSTNHEIDTFVGNHSTLLPPTVQVDATRGGRGRGKGTAGGGTGGRGGGGRGRGDGGKFLSNRRQRGADRKVPKPA